jgi:hypothetical protein
MKRFEGIDSFLYVLFRQDKQDFEDIIFWFSGRKPERVIR